MLAGPCGLKPSCAGEEAQHQSAEASRTPAHGSSGCSGNVSLLDACRLACDKVCSTGHCSHRDVAGLHCIPCRPKCLTPASGGPVLYLRRHCIASGPECLIAFDEQQIFFAMAHFLVLLSGITCKLGPAASVVIRTK